MYTCYFEKNWDQHICLERRKISYDKKRFNSNLYSKLHHKYFRDDFNAGKGGCRYLGRKFYKNVF